MNKRGQTIFYMMMMGVVFFLLGLALAPALHETVSEQTDSVLLNCSNTSISDQNKAVCTSLDILPTAFFMVLMGLAGILIGGIAIR